jgi:hypothetical protein
MQPASGQRLRKHTSAQAQRRHIPTVLSYQLFSSLSMPRLHNTSPLAAKESPEEFLVELRGSIVIEQEMTRKLHSDLKP